MPPAQTEEEFMLRYLRTAARIATLPIRAARRRPRRALLLTALVLVAAVLGAVGYAEHQWRKAQAALAAERPEEARSRLDVCLWVWPRNAKVHFLVARAARLGGDTQTAEAHLNECLKLEGATQAVQLEFLLLRVQTGEVDEVAATLIECVENGHPEAPLILQTLGRAYMHLLRYKEAFACLSRWAEETPHDAKPYQWRGWVRERLNRPQEAMQDYRKALEQDPNLFPVRLRLAEMLVENHDPLAALPHFELLLKQYPHHPELQARLGQCRFLQGQHAEARRLLEQAVEKLPRDLPVLIHLSKLDSQENRPAQAEEWLRRALEVAPNDPEALFSLITVLQLQGRSEEAAATLKQHEHHRALVQRTNQLLRDEQERSTNHPDVASEIGSLLLRIDREKLGVYWLDRALVLDPAHQASHQALAEYYESKGEHDKAAAHRRKLR
jgi:tetratricopeptide (TPR) repeat protein